MKRRAVLALAVALAASSPLVAVEASGPLVSRTAYVFPFATRAAWFDFVRGTPGGADAARDLAATISEAEYARKVAQTETRFERIVYRSDGLAIRGFLVTPVSGGKHPVIIYNHGGVMQWGRIVLPELLEFQRLAERGYVVLASMYRGEGGSEGVADMSGGDVADTLALLDVAAQLPEADTGRVGMWGVSRGGLVAYGALARTGRIAAAAIVGGPADLLTAPRRAEFDAAVYPTAVRDYARDKDAALVRISALHWPERLAATTPILLLHGGDDPRVPPADSLRMAVELQRLKRSYRLKIFEGGSHALTEHIGEVRAELDRWFDRYVRDALPAPRNGVAVLANTP